VAITGFLLVSIGGLARAASNLTVAFSGHDVPLLATTLYVFAGPGFTLMAAALVRSRAIALGRKVSRDPWIAPTVISWLFLLAAFYLNASRGGAAWSIALVSLALVSHATTGIAAAALGWRRQLHMAAGLFALNIFVIAGVVALQALLPQNLLIEFFAELLSLAAQVAFAFASWRVAAEYNARVGPTAAT
jgi:hypothetical protein